MTTAKVESDPFPGCHFGHCHLEIGDFVDAVRNEPGTASLVRTCTWAGVGGCVGGVYLMTTPRYGLGIALLGLGAVLGSVERAPEYVARRWLARTPPQERELRFTVSDAGLVVASKSSSVLYAWHSLEGFHATPRSLLLWVSRKNFLIVPRRAFEQKDLPAVLEAFETRAGGSPPSAARFFRGVALVAILGLMALWAWNELWPR